MSYGLWGYEDCIANGPFELPMFILGEPEFVGRMPARRDVPCNSLRIDGNANQCLLFVDASNDSIGIGTTTPSHVLNICTDTDFDGPFDMSYPVCPSNVLMEERYEEDFYWQDD